MCERIETRRTRKSIESEITKFRRRIQQEEPHAAERDGVVKSYTEKMEHYKKTMAAIRGHKTSLKVTSVLSQAFCKRWGEVVVSDPWTFHKDSEFFQQVCCCVVV